MKITDTRINVLLTILFIALLPILFLFTDVQIVAFDRDYYRTQYENYNISQAMDIEMPELINSTNKLLLYMEGKRDTLDFETQFNNGVREFFSERDKLHMVDVKQLFSKGRMLRNIAAFYILFFLFYLYKTSKDWKKKLAKYNIIAFIAGILPIIALILLMNTDFNKYFTIFHEMFFNNDLWLLEPAQDTLINMFPESFFADTAFRIGYLYIAELLAIFIFSSGYLILQKNKIKDNIGGF